jgi:RecA/RadA recombinase
MGKPFDVAKFRRGITKSIPGMSVGFRDPKTWISTGNYCLNYLISGSFTAGVPLGKVSILAGSPGAGKSLVASGSIIKNAQAQGIYVILVDSENALDEAWLQAIGVDTSDEKLLKLNMAMINDVAKMINDFVQQYRDIPIEDRPKVLFVIDSLGMLLTPTMIDQFAAGELKGDMGIKAKQLKALIINCVNMFGDLEIGMIATNHTYSSQDKYTDDIISGGSGPLFAASIVVSMNPLKLKENEDGVKGSDVLGIRSKCKILKTRYNKPFEAVEVVIPWTTGIDPYSGLFDLFEKQKLIAKEGNRYVYADLSGIEHKHWRKEYLTNSDGILDLIMKEFDSDRTTNLLLEGTEDNEIVDNTNN